MTSRTKKKYPGTWSVAAEFARRTWGPLLALAVSVMAIGAGAGLLSRLFPALLGLLTAVAIFCAIGLWCTVWIYCVCHHYTVVAGREAPLWRTMPLTGRALFAGLFLWGVAAQIIAVVASMVAVALALVIGIPGGIRKLRIFFQRISELVGDHPGLAVLGALLMVLTVLSVYASGIFAAQFGSVGALGRMGLGGPVVAFVAVYLAAQVLGLLGALLPGVLDVSTFDVEWRSIAPILFDSFRDSGAQPPSSLIPLGVFAMNAVVAAVLVAACLWDAGRVRDIQ